SSYEISSAEGVCYQRGNLIKCTAYGMENDENAVISIAFDGADFEDINVQNTLINGEVVDYSIEVTDTSIEQKGVEVRKVIVYPNPAHNELNVVVIHEAEIAIYNALGYLISKDKTYNGQATFNVKGFTSGIYQVKILQEGKSIMTVPVVINNISGLRK
ncbi:MAG: T9SS type A sorting domain-containing protein, partial [Bacteroidales bacterium]